jgi:hydroxymethylbilane synthase
MTLLRLATRRSPLALWQAHHVADLLRSDDPELEVELVEIVTQGDKILDQALSRVGGKDLFVKEIEVALMDGRADLAVHSLKDVPTSLPEGLEIAAFPPREDPRDAFVSLQHDAVDSLPAGARVGTSSLRRAAQLLALRPDLKIETIRGNVQTRLKRMEEQGMDGTMLAYAGLKRLGMAEHAREVMDPSVMIPAVGQGILAIEVRSDDAATKTRVQRLEDPAARAAAVGERGFLRRLEGGCQVPIAAHTFQAAGEDVRLVGLVSSLDGRERFSGERTGPVDATEAMGIDLAEELLGQGAGAVLAELKGG